MDDIVMVTMKVNLVLVTVEQHASVAQAAGVAGLPAGAPGTTTRVPRSYAEATMGTERTATPAAITADGNFMHVWT